MDTTIGGNNVFVLTDPTGATIEFYDFSGADPGQFLSKTDTNGNVTKVTTTNGAGQITAIQRSNPATSEVEQWAFTYSTIVSGYSQVITEAQLERNTGSGGTFVTVRNVQYGYYDNTAPPSGTTAGGNPLDLASATVYAGSTSTNPISTTD